MTPGPLRSSESRRSHRPPPPPQELRTEAQGMREEKGSVMEGGATSGRNSSPRSGTFLGRGEGAGRGMGEGGKKS